MKNLLFLPVAALLFFPVAAGEKNAPKEDSLLLPPPPPPVMRGAGDSQKLPRRFFYLAFNSMSKEERSEFMKLQSTDPALFQQQIRERAEKIIAEFKARAERMKKLAGEYRSADDKRKAEIKTELEKMVREDYLRHLERGKKRLEEMKKGTARLEKELARREVRKEDAIRYTLDRVLSGKPPFSEEKRPGKEKIHEKF